MSATPASPADAAAQALREAIAALEAQRGLLGDAVADAAQAPLRERLAALQAQRAGDPSPGTAVQPGPPSKAEQQLRQVSVLFVDVAGSTALSQQLDPEDLHLLMDGSLRRYTACVQRHGGTVLQYAGDNLLAAFGTPPAREDDAERAVLAALTVLDEARAVAEEVRARYGHEGYTVRAGIATGPVLLGGGIEGMGSIRGMVVNIAARMEQTAPPGRLRICPDTQRLVRGLFEVEAQLPLAVKGVDAPLVTWLVQRRLGPAPAQAARGVGGVHCPLVGRERELQALCQAWQGHRDAPRSSTSVALVLGDAGVGKTRLAGELKAWARPRAPASVWLEAHASERGTEHPYGVLRQLFTRHLCILDSDLPEDARRSWLQAMKPLLGDDGDAAVLGHLLGLDFSRHDEVQPLLAEGRQLRDRAFFHATQALRAIAGASGPLTIFIDDLQWVDTGTLDFLDQLQQRDADLTMLLCSSRPTLTDRHANWVQRCGGQRIELTPLATGAAGALADALLVRLGASAGVLRGRLIEVSEGNPFYMEEMVNMLIDRGAIVTDGDAWRLGEVDPDRLPMPRTVAGVLQARLDEVGQDEAQALQWAAIVGPVFWQETLTFLGLQDSGCLDRLVQRQFIVPRAESSLLGQHEYAFRHHLLHQVCLDRVLRRVRVPAHALVARWLASQPGRRPLHLIADHHERGEEPVLAARAWRAAAEDAQHRFANAEALAHVERALALTPADDLETLFPLRMLREQVLGLLARRDEQAAELEALQVLAVASGQAGDTLRVAHRRAMLHLRLGDAAGALVLAEEVLAQAPELSELYLLCGHQRCAALGQMGRIQDALAQAHDTLDKARAWGFLSHEAVLFNEIAMLELGRGDFGAALVNWDRALELERATGRRSNEAGVLTNLGYLDMSVGRYEAARARFEMAIEIFRRVGQRDREGIVLVNQGIVALNAGSPAKAWSLAAQARDLLAATRNRWAEAAALRVLGQAQLAAGEPVAALATLQQAMAAFNALGYMHLAAEVTASMAQAALVEGDRPLALRHALAVLDALSQPGTLDGAEEPLRMLLGCWQGLHAAQDARAVAVMQQGRALLARRARRIGDRRMRRSYLMQVPHHVPFRTRATPVTGRC